MKTETWFDEAVFAKLEKTVRGDRLRQLLELFIESTSLRIEEVESADAVGDPDKVAFALHSLKGSALMVGARELEEAAEALRGAVRGGEHQALTRGRDRLAAALARVHARVREELARLDEQS